MKLSQIMDRHLVAVSPHASIGAAAKLMKSSNVDLLLVVHDGALVGIVSESAFAGVPDSDSAKPIEGIMQAPLCVEESSSINDAVKYLIEHDLGRLPVVSSKKSMKCAGTVGSTELVRAKKSEDAGA
jgi:CBS domain-containing protein